MSCQGLMTRDDISKQNQEQQLQEQVSNIQKQKADNEAHYQDLQNDLRVIAGRVDALDHAQAVAQKQHQKETEDLKKVIETQNEKIKVLEQHIDATETRLTAAIQALSTAPVQAAPAPATGRAEKGASKKGEGGATFTDAQDYFQKKDWRHAITHFQSYLDKNPKGAKRADATYMIGVCFQELGMKNEAKDFFSDTISNYAGTPSAKKAKFRLSQLK
jgi:TolA-binding protein